MKPPVYMIRERVGHKGHEDIQYRNREKQSVCQARLGIGGHLFTNFTICTIW